MNSNSKYREILLLQMLSSKYSVRLWAFWFQCFSSLSHLLQTLIYSVRLFYFVIITCVWIFTLSSFSHPPSLSFSHPQPIIWNESRNIKITATDRYVLLHTNYAFIKSIVRVEYFELTQQFIVAHRNDLIKILKVARKVSISKLYQFCFV